MKACWLLIPLMASMLGCTAMPPGTAGLDAWATPASPVPMPMPMAQPANFEPGGMVMVVPATGGAPVPALPAGGSLFVPTGGGAPIVGLPTTH